MPPIIMPSVSLDPSTPTGRTRKDPFPRHNLTLAHVHKTGGTSLIVAMGQLSQRGARTGWNCLYDPTVKPRINEELRAESSTFLDSAVKYRTDWGAEHHTLFAVARDPAERFISAIRQATGGRGSMRNGVNKLMREECSRDTGREMLKCFVNLVKSYGTWIELHFAPMALEISFATMYKDVPVAIFPFEEVPSLLYELDANPMVKMKDGAEKSVRSNEVLINLTVSDYDKDDLRTLCEIYMVDVMLFRHIGLLNHCDRFL